MRKYWDADECYPVYMLCDLPTACDKKGIEIDRDMFRIYQSVEKTYWLFQEWLRGKIENDNKKQ